MEISNSGKGINLWGSGLVEATVGKNALFENNTGRVFEIKDYASAGSSLTFDDGLVVKDNNLTESGDYFGNVYNSANSEMIFSGSSTFENNTTQRANGNAGVFQNWGKLSFEGDASFDSNAANGVAGAIRNRGEYSNTEFNANVEFTDNKALKDAGAVINEGTMTFAKKANFEGNIAGATVDYVEDENGIYVDTETGQHYSIALGDVDTTSNYNGGAVNNTKDIVFNDEATFTGNKASGLGGAVYNAANGVVNFNDNATFSGNTANNSANDIYNAGTINFNSSADLAGGIDGDAGVVNVNGDVKVANALKNQTVNVADGIELHLDKADATGSTVNLGSDAVLNTINNAVDDYSAIKLASGSNIKVDANLNSGTMDNFGADYGQLDLNIVEANMIGSSDEEVTMQLVKDGTKVNTSSFIYEWDDEAKKHTKTGIVGSGAYDGKVKVSNGVTVSNLEVAARDTSSAVKESVVYEMGESENFGTETIENATFVVEGNNQSVNVSGTFGVDNKSVVAINDTTFNGDGAIANAGIMEINDSNINVNLNNSGTLISDPTIYTATVTNTGTASFDGDTFTSTATLSNSGTATFKDMTFEKGSKIDGNGATTGVLNFNGGDYTLLVEDNNINLENGAKIALAEGSDIDGQNLTNDANNGTIDLRNKRIDTLGSTSLGSDLNVLMDLDLNADKSDTLGTITNNGYGLNLNALELLALGGDEEHVQIATAGTDVALSSDVTNTLKTYYKNVEYTSADGKLNLTDKQQYASADLVGSWGSGNYIKAYNSADAAGTSVGANLTILDEQVKTNEDAISAAETAIGNINDDITVATAGNYIAAGTEVANNLTALDTQVKTNADAIATKQDKLIAGNGIAIATDGKTVSIANGSITHDMIQAGQVYEGNLSLGVQNKINQGVSADTRVGKQTTAYTDGALKDKTIGAGDATTDINVVSALGLLNTDITTKLSGEEAADYAVSGKRGAELAANIATYVAANGTKFADVQNTANIITDLFNDKAAYIQETTGMDPEHGVAYNYNQSSEELLHGATSMLNADEKLAGAIAKRKVTVDATTGIASITDGTTTANVYTKEAAEAIFNEKRTWVDNTLGITSANADAVKEQYASTNYLKDATTLTGADKALDSTIKTVDNKFTDGSVDAKFKSVTTTGDATIGGNAIVNGVVSAQRYLNSNGTFSVSTGGTVTGSNLISNNDLTVAKNATIGGDLTVDGLASLDGGINVNEKFSVDTNGNTTVLGNLGVSGTSFLKDTTVDGGLGVTGNATIAQNLGVGGTAFLNAASVTNDLGVGGNATVAKNFSVGGTSFLKDTTVDGGLGVTGDATVVGTAKVGALTFNGTDKVNAIDTGTAAITDGDATTTARKETMATNATVAKTVGKLANLENTHGVTSVADVASAINSLATNVETATGGTFTNAVWTGKVTVGTTTDYTYGGDTGYKNVMAAVSNIASNIGTATTAANGNITSSKSVNANLDQLDSSIGDRSNLGSANEAINQGTKTSVAAGMRAVGDAIGDMNFAGSHYVAGNNDLSGAVRSLDSNLYRVESDLRDLRRDFRRGMASMSAMSALVPNPRAHGNTSLAIGTGAYDGHTAAAIGGFHYLTDNIMLNAGVAWGNSSDAAYRMGVTFSW